jgi:signal transduction histidine kinase
MNQIVQNNSRRLVRLVHDTLDFKNVEEGPFKCELRPIEVHALVERSIEVNTDFAILHHATARKGCSRDVAMVRADPHLLMQAVTILLKNAITVSPTGNEVVATIENGPDVVRISVCDQGPGVPIELQSQTFETVARADAVGMRSKGGIRLGLGIVKQIATRLDGKVGFVTIPGRGSTFYIDVASFARKICLVVSESENDPDLAGTTAAINGFVEAAHFERQAFNPRQGKSDEFRSCSPRR